MNLVPQFGFLELILIAVVALIVVGPRDLPRLMRQAGRMVAKARAMAAEFTAAFDQMARETEMEELRKELDSLKNDTAIAKAKRELDETVRPISEELRKAPTPLKAGSEVAKDKTESDAEEDAANNAGGSGEASAKS